MTIDIGILLVNVFILKLVKIIHEAINFSKNFYLTF